MKVHNIKEVEHFPFDTIDHFKGFNFITKDFEMHNIRSSPYSFFIEEIKKCKEKQHMRWFNVRPSCEKDFFNGKTVDSKSQFNIIVEYINSVPLQADENNEQKAFYLFETLITLEDCLMPLSNLKLVFNLRIRDTGFSTPNFYDFVSRSKYKELLVNLIIEDPTSDDDIFSETPEISFEASIHGGLVAKGERLISENHLIFGFTVYVNDLLEVSDKQSYNVYNICPENKKVIINMPSEQYTWLEVAKSFWKKHTCTEIVLCCNTIKRPLNKDENKEKEDNDDNDDYVDEDEKEKEFRKYILSKVNHIGDTFKKESTKPKSCICPEKIEKFEIIIDPNLKDLNKSHVLKQVENKWKHLYYKEVSIIATGEFESTAEIARYLCSNPSNIERFTRKKITNNLVIFVSYPKQEDNRRNYEKPQFFQWINNRKLVTEGVKRIGGVP